MVEAWLRAYRQKKHGIATVLVGILVCSHTLLEVMFLESPRMMWKLLNALMSLFVILQIVLILTLFLRRCDVMYVQQIVMGAINK